MEKRTRRHILALLAAALLLAVLVLPLAAAGPEDEPDAAEQVLELLEHLQTSDIDPAWLPDIRANQALVQELLDIYLAVDPARRAAFAPDELALLRAYFEALYSLQGMDIAGVDALFEQPGPASPSLPPASAADSVSAAASASVAPSAASAHGGTPQGVGAASLGGVVFPPQVPAGGWAGFFANPALGVGLLLLLLALAGVVFLYFLGALRRAGRAPRASFTSDLRRRELFGENYDPELAGQLVADPPTEPAGGRGTGSRRAVPDIGRAARPTAEPAGPGAVQPSVFPAHAALEPPTLLPRPRQAGAPQADVSAEGGAPPAVPPLNGDAGPAREAPALGGGEALPRAAKRPFGRFAKKRPAGAPPPAPAAAAGDEDDGFGPDGFARMVDNPWGEPDGDAPSREPVRLPAPPPRDTPPDPPLPRPRAQRRTGRPGKMTFRQGAPEDIDAIDE